ncbi:exo-beta-N-acetylmuramidase NamZ domain-containing protein [Lacinutrix sp. Hel_I_90]|uniref:exo-beta-N-acetylmuramidase NamZ family protein n=1 Tax=Lacinutrix sp. Hel_I_90 TaxID=1249999 RepID=UPI0005C92A4A|nr:DUF1343 domain-containing protein [Lacinutrix sp. Hel_I_90]
MRLTLVKNTVLLFLFLGISCGKANKLKDKNETLKVTPETELSKELPLKSINNGDTLVIGANRTEMYLPLLKGKRVGVVANQTSIIFKTAATSHAPKNEHYIHIVDSLKSSAIAIQKVFAPEHGFRGMADAGEIVKDGIDTKTGLPIISLYGQNKKPSKAQLANIDVMVFDIQDVGARFYTYISSLHYVMEACAEHNIPLIVLDRPNPNGHYVDGPILEKAQQSFVGMHPVPVVHGMTIGEYAQMINGEHWLENGVKCALTVIPVKQYSRDLPYQLPIKPSPNLPNDTAINLYPSLCFFEGTNVSVGRGTALQFQIYGSPFLTKTDFTFVPKPNEGAQYPKHENKICNGYDLSNHAPLKTLDLSFLINAYKNTKEQSEFFISNGFFTKLAGTKKLQEQIENGLTEEQIKATWKDGLDDFIKMRTSYLLYN